MAFFFFPLKAVVWSGYTTHANLYVCIGPSLQSYFSTCPSEGFAEWELIKEPI